MPRVGRHAPAGVIFHVLNRGNGRQKLFHKPADYDAFVKLVAQIAAVVPVKILAYCLMPNHWHLVVMPLKPGALSKFMQRLTTAHVRRRFAHTHDATGGHLYQGRFKSFPTQDDHHFLILVRYVEANALRGGLVKDPTKWKWCSLAARETTEGKALLGEWPVPRPARWAQLLAEPLPDAQVESIRTSIRRGRPLGSSSWMQQIAAKLDLGFTLRPRGRPRKNPIEPQNKN
jgi:putative transposase